MAWFMNARGIAMSLHLQLNRLASAFAESVFQAIRELSLEELVAETGGLRGMEMVSATGRERGSKSRGEASARRERSGRRTSRRERQAAPRGGRRGTSGRLKRRSPKDIERALGEVVSLIESNPGGMRAEQIRSELGMQPKEMPRILGEGLASRRLKKRGHKRATTYYAT
jgi:hypothetical protein